MNPCEKCGANLKPGMSRCIKCGTATNQFVTQAPNSAHNSSTDLHAMPQVIHVSITPSSSLHKSPGVALLLSLIIVGAGQMYNGQVVKGILMLVGAIILWFFVLGWVIAIWSAVDAYSTAKKINQGLIVKEGH